MTTTGVLSRALGLLEMVQRTKRQGGRLCFVNERGDIADVVCRGGRTMSLKIDQDHGRFREIVRGKISRTCASTSRRRDDRQEGQGLVSIPLP